MKILTTGGTLVVLEDHASRDVEDRLDDLEASLLSVASVVCPAENHHHRVGAEIQVEMDED